MGQSANVRSLDSVRAFAASVVKFQEEARQSVTSLEMQLQRVIGWLERDRPAFWKREIEKCYRDISEARVRLHQCQMRKHGDFKPTCYEEKKDLERAKKALEYSQKQVPVLRQWTIAAHQEANEYHGRSSQLTQVIERDIPEVMALLHRAIDRLESYADVAAPLASATGEVAATAQPSDTRTESEAGDVQADSGGLSEIPDDAALPDNINGGTSDEER